MKRIEWVDNAKGIAIVLVVLGHLNIPDILHNIIYSFHMHLFFFLSGIFFKAEKDFKTFVIKKAKTIMLPYFIFGILDSAISIFREMKAVGFENVDYFLPFVKLIKLGTFWFLPVLFMSMLIFWLIHKWVNKYTCFYFIVIMGLIHYVTQGYLFKNLILGWICHIAAALIFLLFGYISNELSSVFDWKDTIVAFIIFYITLYLGNEKYGAMTIVKFDSYIYAYTLAFTGIVIIVGISKLIPKNKYLVFFGTNSLIIYLLHGHPGAIYSRVFKYLRVESYISSRLIYSLLQTAACLLILVPIIIFINKYLSWTLGRYPNSAAKTSSLEFRT